MSKYEPLWQYLKSIFESESVDSLTLSFEVIENCLGFKLDHSFLKYKKELLQYDLKVEKISLKNEIVTFIKQ